MMKSFALLLAVAAFAAAEEQPPIQYKPVAISELEQAAQARMHSVARVSLASSSDDNYARALSLTPAAVDPMKKLVDAALFTGSLDPEVKEAMGLRISQLLKAPYVSARMLHLLRATGRGKSLLDALYSDRLQSLPAPDRLAISYAEWLTQDVHGVTDADFALVRQHFNDSQIVELTTTTCFFAYMTRFSEALRLPVEEAMLGAPASPLNGTNTAPIARVSLISDAEIDAIEQAKASVMSQEVKKSLGLNFANSMRAMYLAPEMAQAWFQYMSTTRQYSKVSREIKLQVSFAVSTANNCRYCTLHQVLGLRRLGVSPSKLMQMRKDDSALTSEELAAVQFARKLTVKPWLIEDADYANLTKTFGDQGALEVVMQACAFSYMNHFTDGLRLPSEDVAVKTYLEVYGHEYSR